MNGRRFLALGDSYTIGEGVDASARWPDQLAARLRTLGVDVDAPVLVARTGWTTDELDAGISAAGIAGVFDLVSLLIGVNNQYRGRPLGEYATQFDALLARGIAFAGQRAARVVVLSIPDWSVTPFADGRDRARIAGEVDAFNAAAHAGALRAGARWVDVTPLSRVARDGWFAADGLHPSAAQYAAWADAALAAARAALRD
ncbi:MAG TPA: GDSL-type esterase/lipase family protein [Gemmatimonadaceae bacterium]|nr:GDSL-type esterase/lipase family protein [Gemmatimonadaceae bacterium]